MMRIFVVLGCLLLVCGAGLLAQGEADTTRTQGAPPSASGQKVQTQRRDMPRLEIPEITIVGKKAITLPFARKGELFDVPIYDAPPPDSSLLLERPPVMMPPARHRGRRQRSTRNKARRSPTK